MIAILLIGMLVIILLGVPIGFSLGISSALALIYGKSPLIVIPQKMFGGIDSFPILAIPFFMLAGELMNYGGINEKIIRISSAYVGWIRGSLSMVTVAASMFFAAISGSAVATVSAIGGVTIPAMKKEGYPPEFAAAVSASSSVCGPIIPPSIPLIVYGSAMMMSISDLFMAAVIPGIMLGLALLGLSYYISRKNNFPKNERSSKEEKIASLKDGLAAILMPAIILGGIFSGLFTPTEAAVVSAIYAFIVGKFVYKSIKMNQMMEILSEAAISTSVVMIILATSKITSWIVVVSNLPTIIQNAILGFTNSGVVIMLLIYIILLLVGTVMEANAAMIILIPILVPLAATAGINSLTFGICMTFCLCLGLLTPPVGASLLLGNNIADARFERSIVASIPFFLIGLVILLLITFIPALTMWLPNMLK